MAGWWWGEGGAGTLRQVPATARYLCRRGATPLSGSAAVASGDSEALGRCRSSPPGLRRGSVGRRMAVGVLPAVPDRKTSLSGICLAVARPFRRGGREARLVTSGWLKGQAAEREEVRGALRLGVGDVTGKPTAVPCPPSQLEESCKATRMGGWGRGLETS